MSHDFEEKLYQDITDVGGFAMAKAVKTWHQQELQKAREEERENINNWAQYTFAYQPSVLKEWEAMYYRMTHDQSELDQPIS